MQLGIDIIMINMMMKNTVITAGTTTSPFVKHINPSKPKLV
jgi:hypothetical protein